MLTLCSVECRRRRVVVALLTLLLALLLLTNTDWRLWHLAADLGTPLGHSVGQSTRSWGRTWRSNRTVTRDPVISWLHGLPIFLGWTFSFPRMLLFTWKKNLTNSSSFVSSGLDKYLTVLPSHSFRPLLTFIQFRDLSCRHDLYYHRWCYGYRFCRISGWSDIWLLWNPDVPS